MIQSGAESDELADELAQTRFLRVSPELRPALLLHGPTASGKSALALALARKFSGAIINADAMQVYDGLRILTNRPDPEETGLVPHFLFGHKGLREAYSVGIWLGEALGAIARSRASGHWPILVGGTGLYFLALTRGLADAPPTPSVLLSSLKAELESHGAPALHARLAEVDPAIAARICPTDHPRLLRALAVFRMTGRPLSAFWADTRPALAPDHWRGLLLRPPRAALYTKIDQRLKAMIESGALAEIAAARAAGLRYDDLAWTAHGLPWFAKFLDGEVTMEEACEKSARDTRHYAKRQFTFAAHQFADWPVLEEISKLDKLANIFSGFLEI